jgi:hypothetical protein
MPEPDLTLIARTLERLLGEMRTMREQLAALPSLRDEVRLLREEGHLLREEVRLARADIARLDDTVRMNVLERLQALEHR